MKIFRGQFKYHTNRLYRANFINIQNDTSVKRIFFFDEKGYTNVIERPSTWYRIIAQKVDNDMIDDNYSIVSKCPKVKKLNRGK